MNKPIVVEKDVHKAIKELAAAGETTMGEVVAKAVSDYKKAQDAKKLADGKAE